MTTGWSHWDDKACLCKRLEGCVTEGRQQVTRHESVSETAVSPSTKSLLLSRLPRIQMLAAPRRQARRKPVEMLENEMGWPEPASFLKRRSLGGNA